ncbi:ABC transporter permease subunit [Corynebacterium aquatimens]|uniref:ABC transporter permease subunit n=1 Tax=Corynebacterium TaxID=1716 RepID=UPI001F221B13|nr:MULTISPECIES: ABC transporter permease subunit [Corynebacterium]QYH19884.1 ABC transporter permease subunit [Corynebacterium aquatimens]UIZ92957.1 ABC transporter permease subunit [Corynebacterium sp. CNCTC7651]
MPETAQRSTAPTRIQPRVPVAVATLAAVALATIVLPIAALGLRVPWAGLGAIAADPATSEMLRVTLASALLATLLCLLLGLPLALWMQRGRNTAHLARLLVLLPLALPPVVAGLALTALLGNRGALAPLLNATGITFAFAFPGVVAAHTFIALPFVVITLDTALRQLDPEVVDSAHGVGLSPATTIRKVVLPAIRPALVSAAGLAFARSLGEFGTTLTFAGSMPGTTRTMPLGIYLAREIDQDLAYGLAAILVALALATLALSLLPTLLHRDPAPQARETGSIDITGLAELTRPAAEPPAITAGTSTFPAGTVTALIGPNGAGKTTLAGRIAGRLTGLTIAIGGRTLQDDTRTHVPPHQRGVVLLTQNPGLPPTATALTAVEMVAGTDRARELLAAAGRRAWPPGAAPRWCAFPATRWRRSSPRTST